MGFSTFVRRCLRWQSGILGTVRGVPANLTILKANSDWRRKLRAFVLFVGIPIFALISTISSSGDRAFAVSGSYTVTSGSTSSYSSFYNFNAGEILTAYTTSATGDPYLRFKNASGVEVAFNDDSAGGGNSLITYTIPTSGQYRFQNTCYKDSSCSYTVVFSTQATITATGTNASICNQNVENGTGVTAERLNNYCIVTFKNVGTTNWTTPSNVSSVEVMVVGGGGAGGGENWAGGGGAGSVVYGNKNVSSGSNYSVTVGAGGLGQTNFNGPGGSGGSSTFWDWTANGGGGGASTGWSKTYVAAGVSGGSGGGSGEDNSTPSGGSFVQTDYPGATEYGNRGGNQTFSNGSQTGGGGGGAGSAGEDAGYQTVGKAGGSGITLSLGGSKAFNVAAGGGGSTVRGGGSGGYAGGVQLGGSASANGVGGSAVANTGSGGGGGSNGNKGGDGGSGLVVLAYAVPQIATPSAPTLSATSNTLKSLSVSWSTVSNATSYTLRLYNGTGTQLLATFSNLGGNAKTLTTSDY